MSNNHEVKGFSESAEFPSVPGEFNKFPLGVDKNGEAVTWDIKKDPHLFLIGTTGSGKSIVQRGLILHCIQNPEHWRVSGIDLKKVELEPYNEYLSGVATNNEHTLRILQGAQKEMRSKYEDMKKQGVSSWLELEPRPKAHLILIDEAFMFMAPVTDDNKDSYWAALRTESIKIIGDIARLGRAAGIHLVVSTQRERDVREFLGGETVTNITARYAAGSITDAADEGHVILETLARVSVEEGNMIRIEPCGNDSDANNVATIRELVKVSISQNPGGVVVGEVRGNIIRGRGVATLDFDEFEVQAYYTSAERLEKWVEEHPLS